MTNHGDSSISLYSQLLEVETHNLIAFYRKYTYPTFNPHFGDCEDTPQAQHKP